MMRARLMQMARLVMASMLDAASSINFRVLMTPSNLLEVQQTLTSISSTR